MSTPTPTPIPILRYRPQAEGLERWFGSLEAAIMDIVWSAGSPRTIKQIWRALQESYADIAYTTAMTTVHRLWKKGLLIRDPTPRPSNTHVYRPSCSDVEFEELQRRAILQSLEEAK